MPGTDESTVQDPSTEATSTDESARGGQQSGSPRPDTAAGEPVTNVEDLTESEKAVAGSGSYEGVPMSDDQLSDVWQSEPAQNGTGDADTGTGT